jgi:hypothetical protein
VLEKLNGKGAKNRLEDPKFNDTVDYILEMMTEVKQLLVCNVCSGPFRECLLLQSFQLLLFSLEVVLVVHYTKHILKI